MWNKVLHIFSDGNILNHLNCLSKVWNIFWGSLPFNEYTIWEIVINSTDNHKGFLEHVFWIFILTVIVYILKQNMLSEIEIQKRGRHYRVFGIVNDRISNYKQFKHIGAEK